MECDNIKIVCYAGGTCGDLIASIIDPQDAVLNLSNGTVSLPQQRTRLKKPHTFESESDKDQYIQSLSDTITSISSHDLDYHLSRQHEIIGITVQHFDIALWAAQRFKQLHRPHVWQEMQARCGASTVEHYAQTLIDYSNMLGKKTNKTIALEDVISSQAITALKNVLDIEVGPAAEDLYQSWMNLQQL